MISRWHNPKFFQAVVSLNRYIHSWNWKHRKLWDTTANKLLPKNERKKNFRAGQYSQILFDWRWWMKKLAQMSDKFSILNISLCAGEFDGGHTKAGHTVTFPSKCIIWKAGIIDILERLRFSFIKIFKSDIYHMASLNSAESPGSIFFLTTFVWVYMQGTCPLI